VACIDAAPVDAAPPPLDAGGPVPACVTTVSLLGGTTSGGAPAPKVLFAFDDASDAGVDPNFVSFSDVGSSLGSPTLDTLDGHPCAGSLTASAAYGPIGPRMQIYYNYGPGNAQDWTGYSTLHFWVKVVATDPATIAGVEPRVDTNNYTQFYGNYVSGTTLGDGGWHEATIDLPPADAGTAYTPSAVDGFQLEFQTTSWDGGVGVGATFLIDSIWLD
jgi:hypothetical protein